MNTAPSNPVSKIVWAVMNDQFDVLNDDSQIEDTNGMSAVSKLGRDNNMNAGPSQHDLNESQKTDYNSAFASTNGDARKRMFTSFESQTTSTKRQRNMETFDDNASVAVDDSSQQLINRSYVQIVNLLEELNQVNRKVGILENQLSESNEANVVLQDQLEAAKQENASLKTERDKHDQTVQRSDYSQENFNELEQKVEELTAKLVKQKQLFVRIAEKNLEVREQYVELKGENSALKRDLAAVNNAKSTVIDEEANRLKQQLDETTQKLVDMKVEHGAEKERADKTTEQLVEVRQKLDESQQKIVGLESELAEEKQNSVKRAKEADNLHQELESSNEEIASLNSKLSEVNELRQKLAEKESKQNNGKFEIELQMFVEKHKTTLQEYRELKKQVDDAAEQRNKIVKDLNTQGMDKYDNEQCAGALAIFFKLIGIEETGRNDPYWFGKLWNNVSICWCGMEKPEKALQASEKAIEYDDSRSVHFYNRAIAHRDLGRRTEAKADFKRLIKLDPTDDDAKDELAKLEKRNTR